MKTSEFDYELPTCLIAQKPLEPRDASRLMIVDRNLGSVEHRRFYELPDFLRKGDVVVFNNSRVFPARLYGNTSSGVKIELLLLRKLGPSSWKTLVRPGRNMKKTNLFTITSNGRDINCEVTEVLDDGSRIIRFLEEENLDNIGVMPLPPYIHEKLENEERYQTVYSKVLGSVAAPTAGLHFTDSLLERLRENGVITIFVTLHVGWDSFRPVRVEEIFDHQMHSEQWELGQDAATIVNVAKQQGRRVVCVGTTAVRLLEQAALSCSNEDDVVAAGSGWADLFIYPGYRFQVLDTLLTNFHLPRSTLLMLTSAFTGQDLLFRAYSAAVDEGYRFYSFGDAMLIV